MLKLTRENYFSIEANRQYLSVSQFKDFAPPWGGCEARAVAKLNGTYEDPPKEAFIEGHYIHSWNSNELDEFKANNPDLYSSRGATAGQLKANYQHCNTMVDVLEADPLAMKALEGEKEVILTAELFGIPWKIMIDSYNPDIGIFTDLKGLRSMDGKFWNKEAQCYENFLERYGYLTQMAIYGEVERLAKGRKEGDWLIPHMVVVTKQDPPDHEIIYFDYDCIMGQLSIVSNHIERVKAVKAGKVEPVRCEACAYCRLTKKIKKTKHYLEFSLY